MRPQPLIRVNDVEASSRWYQRLLGCESAHGGPNYERPTAGSFCSLTAGTATIAMDRSASRTSLAATAFGVGRFVVTSRR